MSGGAELLPANAKSSQRKNTWMGRVKLIPSLKIYKTALINESLPRNPPRSD